MYGKSSGSRCPQMTARATNYICPSVGILGGKMLVICTLSSTPAPSSPGLRRLTKRSRSPGMELPEVGAFRCRVDGPGVPASG